MDLDALAVLVTRHFRDGAERYGLSAADVRAAYTLNWGGFVNAHFEVGDGRRAYHVKLAREPAGRADLARWHALAPLLETRYHAPRIADWIELGGTSGLVFERSDGRPPDLASSPTFVDEVLALLARLHADAELGGALRARGVAGDARGSVVHRYVDCFEADLAEDGDRYPVAPDLVDWMRKEASVMRALIDAEKTFDAVRPVPIHSDLWADNILIEPSGRWLVLDWDDVTLGDPVLDHAVFLWPLLRHDADPARWLGARDEGFMARLRLCLRANLLDEVIDTLADWVAAEETPAHVERVRAAKLAAHRRALADYRDRYV